MKLVIIGIYLIFISLNALAKTSVEVDSVATATVDGKLYKAVHRYDGTLSIYDSRRKTVLFIKSQDLYDESFWRLKFVKIVPLETQDEYKDGKWGFIAWYWKNNCSTFIH